MNPHFKLFSCIFEDESGTIHGVLLDLRWKRDRSLYLYVIAHSGIHDLLDRNIQKSIVMISAEGGMEIEEVAEHNPGAIVKLAIDPAYGLCDYELRKAVADANIPKEARNQMVAMIKNLVKAYEAADAEMVEINPCALTPEGKLIAADAKVSIDDNSLFRHKDYQATASDSAEDAIEAEAQAQAICMMTNDFHRAYHAFVAKQSPVFEGD